MKLQLTGNVLPKKRAFDNRDFKRITSRSKNFSLFQTYTFFWKRENFLRRLSLNPHRISSTPLFWQYDVTRSVFCRQICRWSNKFTQIFFIFGSKIFTQTLIKAVFTTFQIQRGDIHAHFSVSLLEWNAVVVEQSFLSQAQIFQSVGQKVNSDLFSRTFRSAFSFFLFTQVRVLVNVRIFNDDCV